MFYQGKYEKSGNFFIPKKSSNLGADPYLVDFVSLFGLFVPYFQPNLKRVCLWH